MVTVVPSSIKAARAYVLANHRHHGAPLSGLFALAAADGDRVVGVAIVGRPVARMLQDGSTCEVTRLCTDGTRNACSLLYGAAARAAKALGYARILTYTLASEPGVSLRASGWTRDLEVKGRSWDRELRPRIDKHPTTDKVRWSRNLKESA